MRNLRLGWTLARRELRGGSKGLRIVLACLALGVAAIAAVGSLRAGVEAGLQADGARILGGDLEIRARSQPAEPEVLDWVRARGATVSEVALLRSMLIAPSGERLLVELKAVDDRYPLYGTLGLEPAARLDGAVVMVEPSVAERLGISPGDRLRLGEAEVTFAARITEEPDRVATPTIFGPRALIPLSELPATGLIQPGSLVSYEYRFRLPEGVSARAFATELTAAFPSAPWRLRRADQAEPGVNRFLDRAASFLTLAGLTALLVGGIGVATGVRAWLEARSRTIATLRCMGAPTTAIFSAYLIQVMTLSVLGIALGLVGGLFLTWLAAQALGATLPIPPRLAVYPAPLAMAALFGLLTALSFALWPLGRAGRIPGAALFRDTLSSEGSWAGWKVAAANAVAAVALVALVIGTADRPLFGLYFCLGALAAMALFRGGAWVLMAGARSLHGIRRPAWRLGLANLHRPGSATPILLVALGLGLTTLAAIAQIEGNLRNAIGSEMPARAPNFFFIDIQPDQAERFDELARGTPGVEEVRRVPSLRAQIVAVKGVPAEQVRPSQDSAWALRGDRGLTYTGAMPEGTQLVAGQWWAPDYDGPPLVSFDANIARGWGVGIGDTITISVLGRDIDLTIANLRQVEWRSLGMNFTLIASPGLLSSAPHTHIATVRGDASADSALLRRITDALPNVSGIRVREALEQVAALLGRIGGALTATGSVTLLAGALVLAGAVAAGQRRRVREAVLLKTVGATRGQILRAFLVEFGVLGAFAGGLAALAGTAAAYAVVTFVMNQPWVFLPGTLALTVAGCMLLVLTFGYAGTALALRVRPAPLLRNE
ncbi:ABC transporter permease [Roseococcus pinisoli]|uniref:FtsX-like permease family protein n=1 Tax=Roseococcus pinisoli TaxID=2835040 RepID=A0ABS5QC44_9PROT|nr:FtsX-like permease family protein [Roseococcus pinisoli]MBS7811257.1 FtsX-like permease family protein [Roseococcus pinisoli]